MYEIILKTWYQEFPNQRFDEVYHELGFEDIEAACKFLGENYEKILDEFPVDGEIIIKYNLDRKIK